MKRTLLALAATTLFVLGGNEGVTRTFVETASIDYDLGFVLTVDARGELIEAGEPHWYMDGRLASGAPPEISLEDEQPAYLLALDDESSGATPRWTGS